VVTNARLIFIAALTTNEFVAHCLAESWTPGSDEQMVLFVQFSNVKYSDEKSKRGTATRIDDRLASDADV
jgi:hypothetical protein